MNRTIDKSHRQLVRLFHSMIATVPKIMFAPAAGGIVVGVTCQELSCSRSSLRLGNKANFEYSGCDLNVEQNRCVNINKLKK